MIRREPLPVKAFCVWCFIIASGLIAAYVIFVALISVWVGLIHIARFGAWVPILTGSTVFVIVASVFFRTSKAILSRLNNEETFDI
jgi:hypothetical protein